MFRPPPRRRTVEAALRDVDHKDPDVRASALADIGAALASEAPAPREAAERARALAKIESLLSDPEPRVRAAAALAFADLRDTSALGKLLVAIEDEDPYVRQMALAAVGELGDSRARERVRRALGDERPEVRFQAVIASPRVAPDEGWTVLEEALGDPDREIRHIALRCAEEHADRTAQPAPRSFLAAARELLADPDATVRAGAAVMLGHQGDASGRAVIVALLSGAKSARTREAEDKAAAIELAGRFGWTEATPALERCAFGGFVLWADPFAWHARVALARMGHERARRAILGDLRARTRDRRTFGVAAAGRARLAEARDAIEAMRGRDDLADPQAVDEALRLLAGEGSPALANDAAPRAVGILTTAGEVEA